MTNPVLYAKIEKGICIGKGGVAVGVVLIRKIFFIATLLVSVTVFLYTVTAGSRTWKKARKAGILQIHIWFERSYYVLYGIVILISLLISVWSFREPMS